MKKLVVLGLAIAAVAFSAQAQDGLFSRASGRICKMLTRAFRLGLCASSQPKVFAREKPMVQRCWPAHPSFCARVPAMTGKCNELVICSRSLIVGAGKWLK